jgi:hypothetical protein
VSLAFTLFRQDLRRYAGFPQHDESDCHYGSHKAITEHLGRVATTHFDIFSWSTSFALWLDGMCLDLQVWSSGHIIDLFRTHLAIEIPVEPFFETAAFLNCGRPLPVVAYAKSGWSNITQDTEYLDSHKRTNEVRCVYKNVGYAGKSRIRWYATKKVQCLPRGETDGIICHSSTSSPEMNWSMTLISSDFHLFTGLSG